MFSPRDSVEYFKELEAEISSAQMVAPADKFLDIWRSGVFWCSCR